MEEAIAFALQDLGDISDHTFTEADFAPSGGLQHYKEACVVLSQCIVALEQALLDQSPGKCLNHDCGTEDIVSFARDRGCVVTSDSFKSSAAGAVAGLSEAGIMLSFMCGELQSLRLAANEAITAADKEVKESSMEEDGAVAKDYQGTSAALCALERALMLPAATPALDVAMRNISKRVAELIHSELGPALLSPPALLGDIQLDASRREALERTNESLREDFAARRAMLLQRCDASMASFRQGTSGRQQEPKPEMEADLALRRKLLVEEPGSISVDDTLAAGPAVLWEQMHTLKAGRGEASRSSDAMKKVLMGEVPDRGGRPAEHGGGASSGPPSRQGKRRHHGKRKR